MSSSTVMLRGWKKLCAYLSGSLCLAGRTCIVLNGSCVPEWGVLPTAQELEERNRVSWKERNKAGRHAIDNFCDGSSTQEKKKIN